MKVQETYLKGCFVLTPLIFEDERGFFLETFNTNSFREATGINTKFVQDNLSKSSKGILRGLHFQKGEHAQAKLVQVISGSVLDVCVDLRRGSKTFGQHFSIYLDAIERQQLYVPRGFAHGFITLENDTLFSYKCDNFYNKGAESGIAYDDVLLNIDWGVPKSEILVSDKDRNLPTFENFV